MRLASAAPTLLTTLLCWASCGAIGSLRDNSLSKSPTSSDRIDDEVVAAVVLAGSGRFDEAVAMLAATATSADDVSPDLACYARAATAKLRAQWGEHRMSIVERQALFRDAAQRVEHLWGVEHPAAAALHAELAIFLAHFYYLPSATAEADLAVSLASRAVAVAEFPEAADSVSALAWLAQIEVLRAIGRGDLALREGARPVRLAEQYFPASNPILARMRCAYGAILAEQGHLESAELDLDHGIAGLANVVTETTSYLECLAERATLDERRGFWRRAGKRLLDLAGLAKNKPGGDMIRVRGVDALVRSSQRIYGSGEPPVSHALKYMELISLSRSSVALRMLAEAATDHHAAGRRDQAASAWLALIVSASKQMAGGLNWVALANVATAETLADEATCSHWAPTRIPAGTSPWLADPIEVAALKRRTGCAAFDLPSAFDDLIGRLRGHRVPSDPLLLDLELLRAAFLANTNRRLEAARRAVTAMHAAVADSMTRDTEATALSVRTRLQEAVWLLNSALVRERTPDAAAELLASSLRTRGMALERMTGNLRLLRQAGTQRDRDIILKLKLIRLLTGRRREPSELTDWELRAVERAAELASERPPADLAAAVTRLADDLAYVEISAWRPFDGFVDGVQQWQRRRLSALVAMRGGVTQVDLGEADVVERDVVALRNAIDERAPEVLIGQVAKRISDRLWLPLGGRAHQARRIVVSADGPLAHLPWPVVPDRDGKPLLLSRSISAVPGLAWLATREPVSKPPNAALLMADPDFGGCETLDFGPTPPTRTRVPLESRGIVETRREIEAAAAWLPGATTLTGQDAHVIALFDVARPIVLHLATHGVRVRSTLALGGSVHERGAAPIVELPGPADPRINPMASTGIAFSTANCADNLGILTALGASTLNLLGTELVVLSACDTALGEPVDGEGVLGLARSMLSAGARTVIQAHWRVDDRATAFLISRFFARLRQGESRDEALRHAQIAVWERDEWHHPAYWAAMQLVGDISPMPAATWTALPSPLRAWKDGKQR